MKPALSSKNLLKSAISLSIASRMCICRTSVHTVSASESTAVLSSYAPTEDWNLYLHNRQKKSHDNERVSGIVARNVYLDPSSIGSKSFAIAWYVNS